MSCGFMEKRFFFIKYFFIIGTIANLATSSACNITNGGPVVIENPEMLKKDKTSATNGHDISRSSSNNSLAKSKLYPQVKYISVS